MATPPTDAQVTTATGYVETQAQTRQAIEAVALLAVLAQVNSFTDWYSTAAITALCRNIVTVVEVAQRQIASSTDLYLTQLVSLARGVIFSPAGSIDPATLRAGITHAGAYGRLADETRFLTSLEQRKEVLTPGEIPKGIDVTNLTPEVIKARVQDRARNLVLMDTALAERAQVQRTLTKAKVTKYRRVIHPEQAKDGLGSCGLCIVASDRVYNTGSLMPLHVHCHCTVSPILVDWDIGDSLNSLDLQKIYDGAGSSTYNDLIATRYTVHDHGELGPIFGYQGDHWRDASDADDDEDHYVQAA